jgi:hypothetical protein
MKTCKLYTVERGEEDILPEDGSHFSLEELQKIVGGYIQGVPLPRGRMLICNEDGMSLNLPLNPAASLAVTGYVCGDRILGNCVIADHSFFKK